MESYVLIEISKFEGEKNLEITGNKLEFIDTIIDFKEELEKSLNRNLSDREIEELRKDYIGRYSSERFKEYLVKKTALHIIFKYIRIRMASETQKLVRPKFNKEGIRTWNELSKNYRRDYYMLYELSCKDLYREEDTRDLFEPSIYDDYAQKTKNVFTRKEDNYIEDLKIYNFETLDPNTATSLFDQLYPSGDREHLEQFLEKSKVVTELMASLRLL